MEISETSLPNHNIWGRALPITSHYVIHDIGQAHATLVTLGLIGLSDEKQPKENYFTLGEKYAPLMKYNVLYGHQDTTYTHLPYIQRVRRYLLTLSPAGIEEGLSLTQEDYEQLHLDYTVSALCRQQYALEQLLDIEEDAALHNFITRSSKALSAFLAGVISMSNFIDSCNGL